jgi:putative oxidoreductase
MKLFSTGSKDTKTSVALLLLRLVAGLSMAFSHGYGKLISFSDKADSFPDPIGLGSEIALTLAVFGEFFCGIFVAIGLATRLSAIPVIITMIVAFAVIHGGDPFAKKEMSLLFLTMFSAIFIAGPGKYSIDNFISK